MRRKDKERDAAFAFDVLNTCDFATISMVTKGCEPYAVPISPALLNGAIYFHCAMEGTKTDVLRANPKVCVSAARDVVPFAPRFTTEYASAIAFGFAIEVTGEAEKIAALRAICERYAPSNMADFDGAIERSLKRTAIWRIDIESITGKQKVVDERS